MITLVMLSQTSLRFAQLFGVPNNQVIDKYVDASFTISNSPKDYFYEDPIDTKLIRTKGVLDPIKRLIKSLKLPL